MCPDSEMLPPSNFEADFLVHQKQVLSHFDYRGLQYHDWSEFQDNAEAEQDEPWHPYDPEIVSLDHQNDLQTESNIEMLEGEKIICYGAVSALMLLFIFLLALLDIT